MLEVLGEQDFGELDLVGYYEANALGGPLHSGGTKAILSNWGSTSSIEWVFFRKEGMVLRCLLVLDVSIVAWKSKIRTNASCDN